MNHTAPKLPAAGRAALVTGVCLWAAAVAAGTAGLWRHQQTPGAPAAPPPTLDSAAREALGLPPSTGRPTLLLLAHPHCPCTRASLHELAKVLARQPGRAEAFVLFVRPEGCPPGWEQTGLWREARAIPGVMPVCDEGGRHAARLGAFTSGQVLLFGADGRLRFAGGITASRGHEGDNRAADVLVALLGGDCDRPAPVGAPVFGCALQGPCRANDLGIPHP